MKKLLTDLFTFFVKITGWPAYMLLIRAKIYREKGAPRHIKGPFVLVSNHTSVYDFALYLYVFFGRTVHFLMAEVLFRKKLLGLFLHCLGGIETDRSAHSLVSLGKCRSILEKGGAVGIFPESRLPLAGEERPLKFQEGAAILALESGVPVIPVYTDGRYFGRCPASVIIGEALDVRTYVTEGMSDKDAVRAVTEALRGKIIALEAELEQRKAGKQ